MSRYQLAITIGIFVAYLALERIRPDADVDVELDEIADSLAGTDQASWGEVFSCDLRRPLMIGVGLAVFQQITGINAIIYYADQIFAAAATLIAVFYVDRFGRRPLLLCGLVGMAVSLTTVGVSFHYLGQVSTGLTDSTSGPSTAGIVTLVGLVVFIASFAAFSVIAYVCVWRRVPETKGRSLEQIQDLWDEADPVATPAS